jgi:hypothetical protein
LVGIAIVGYQLYQKFIVPYGELAEAGEKANLAEQAYWACRQRQASGKNCSCEKELAELKAANEKKMGMGRDITSDAGKAIYSRDYFKKVTGAKK